MAPLDWDLLMKIDIAQLQDDTSVADDLYNVLAEFDVGTEKDDKRLVKLFQVTQAIMVVKGVAAEVVEEQLNEQAMGEGRSTAKKDQEILDLRDEILALKREIADMRRFGADGAAGQDIRGLRDEIYELEGQNATLQREMHEQEKLLAAEKRLNEEYMKKAEDAEKKLLDLRTDNDHLRETVRDYQRQLEAQREQIVQTRGGDQESRSKLSDIRKKLNDALDENILLRQQMERRDEETERIEKQLAEGKMEIEKTLDEYLKLKSIVEASDSLVDGLQRENAGLKAQIESLVSQVKSKADADDAIMAQVNIKVDEWKGILADKDLQIIDLRQQLMRLRDDLNVANMDTDRKSVAVLTKAVEEKDKTIQDLTSKLSEAVAELHDTRKLMDDVRNKVLDTGRDPKNSRRTMVNLQSTIVQHEEQLKDMEERLATAEADAEDKEKQLHEVFIKLTQYEQGIYGLPEAVAEIKKLKEQLKSRDRTVEDYVQSINRCEDQINVLYDEVEELRDRLGLDPREPINIDELRHNKMMHINQDRALNRVLNKEIERLEEERLRLKMQIRELVKTPGVSLANMPLDDPVVETYASKRADVREKPTGNDDVSRKYKQLLMEQERASKSMDSLSEEVTSLKAKNNELETENRAVERALREIRDQYTASARPGSEPLQCPALDKYLEPIEVMKILRLIIAEVGRVSFNGVLLKMVNTRNVIGRYDISVVLKAQVDNLTGRNDELRRELRDVRFEASKAQENLNRANAKLEGLELEVKSLREAGASGGWFQAMPLPEGLAISSSEVIASLNEHLVVALQELSSREKMIEKMETSLENFQRKFAIMRHQQGLLYQEYADEKKRFECELKKSKDELSEVLGKKQEDDARIKEFDRLVDTLSQDEPEVRRRLAEMTRTITVLRVNEQILSRKYTIAQQVETALRQENGRLRKDVIAVETAVSERLGYLQRYKDMASYKIAALQKALDDSVPASELELSNKQFAELTEKYRDKLENTKSLVAFKEESTGYQSEVKRLQDETNMLTKELEIEKEKLHTLEAAFERMRKQGTAKSVDLQDNDLISVAHRLTTLEMKELNERQRAEHASRMYEQQKTILRQLEDRNFELERKFSELTRINLEMQTVDRELRDELAKCVPKSVSDADRKKIADLEEAEARLRIETSKLKEIAEIATNQVQTLQLQHQSHDKELASLRQQLIDIQAQSDEKTVIGKLHRHIVQMQFSEGTAVRHLATAQKKITKLEAQLLRTEQLVDEKERSIYHHRVESRNKVRHLRHTIQDLRRKYTGAVPLSQQEKFAELMGRLQENQRVIEEDLKRTNDQRSQVEDKLAELELQHRGLQELMATIKDGHGAQKVAKWQAKMESVNLENVRHKREIEKLKDQIKYLESIIRKHESEVISLEEDKVRLKRDFETNELEWEQREVELERTITNLEKQQAEIAGAASQFEEAVGRMPDSSMPITHQLEQAVTTIKRNVKLILDSKAQTELFKKKLEELETKLREKERDILNRDRVIAELRLRLPASAERDAVFDKATGQGASPRDENYESSQAIRVATTTVSSLQARIAQKEEALSRYEQLLNQARDEMATASRRHEEEIRVMQKQLHEKNELAFKKYKMAVKESVNQPNKPIASNEQLKRLNELEDIVAEQDNGLSALREKLAREREENQILKIRLDDTQRRHAEEKDKLKDQCNEDIQQVNDEKLKVEQVVSELKTELRTTQQDLEEQKEANSRAPSQTIKSLVERLKNQLALKEKQQQALSKALLDLKADLVTQAQSDVLVNAERAAAEVNVQRIVDKRTKELQDRLEELEESNQKLKGDLRKMKDREANEFAELEQIREELGRKEVQSKKLKEDKISLANEVDELRAKVQRMSTMHKQKAESDAFHQELDELRRKNQALVKELERSKMQAEKPLEHQPLSQREDAVSKWEEGKKLQKKVETLQSRLRDKDAELERHAKANEMMKHSLERANAEKESLETRVRSGTSREPAPKPSSTHAAQDLKKRVHELEDEVASLKRQLVVGRDSAMEELQLRNRFLSEKVENLERAISTRQSSASMPDRGIEYRDLAQREDELQKRMIKLSEENMELRFEVEQANKDIPRLKERNEDLQKYIEILKAEKQQMELMSRSRDSFSSLLSSPSGNLRRIGESGRTPEQLEKAVAVLKKLVEKTRAENERLKKLPSFISADHISNLEAENTELKGQLENLRQKMGASLSERYSSQQKGTAKITADYEKVRKELSKEKDANEKLRLRVRELELISEQQQQQRQAMVADGDDVKQSTGSTTLNDVRTWKLKARLCEEKIKELEEEVDKKSQQIANMKTLLRDSADRERQLMQEKTELEENVSVLERLPPGAKVSDTELMKEYQLSRLRNERLENEKKELLHELQTLRRRAGSATGGLPDTANDDLLSKSKTHDRLASENVDLMTKVKFLQLDKDKLQTEVDKLKNELSNFGPEFFDEIEDLKFRCHEATEQCRMYEEQLSKLSKQFGVSVNISAKR